jgi:hypothetical protein
MNRTEFETMYIAKHLSGLTYKDATAWLEEERTEDGYLDEHTNLSWQLHNAKIDLSTSRECLVREMQLAKTMQIAIDDFCDYIDMAKPNEKSKPVIKALFDLRSKEALF